MSTHTDYSLCLQQLWYKQNKLIRGAEMPPHSVRSSSGPLPSARRNVGTEWDTTGSIPRLHLFAAHANISWCGVLIWAGAKELRDSVSPPSRTQTDVSPSRLPFLACNLNYERRHVMSQLHWLFDEEKLAHTGNTFVWHLSTSYSTSQSNLYFSRIS